MGIETRRTASEAAAEAVERPPGAPLALRAPGAGRRSPPCTSAASVAPHMLICACVCMCVCACVCVCVCVCVSPPEIARETCESVVYK